MGCGQSKGTTLIISNQEPFKEQPVKPTAPPLPEEPKDATSPDHISEVVNSPKKKTLPPPPEPAKLMMESPIIPPLKNPSKSMDNAQSHELFYFTTQLVTLIEMRKVQIVSMPILIL